MAKNSFPITYLAFDGGPCAGKTSILNKLRAFCMQWGIRLIIVPEVAREYFTAIGHGESALVLQQDLLQLQLAHESFYRKKAEQYQKIGERVLVVFDRSLLTGKAYVSDEIWRSALEYVQLTESAIAQRYTNFIHLVTAADGAEEFFVNDEQRLESPEDSRRVDHALQRNAIGLADHITIIGNRKGGLDVKTEDAWYAVLANMGLPVPVEDELWFSVRDDFNLLTIPEKVVQVHIEQSYLSVGDVEERVRMKELPNGERWYFYTEKRPTAIVSKRIERERCITEKQYLKLLERRSPDHETIKKNRYCFVYNYQYFELDEMISPDPGFKFKLEYSRTLANQKTDLPNFLPIIADVTGDPAYKTSEIARKRVTA